jgi:hypothetical protein
MKRIWKKRDIIEKERGEGQRKTCFFGIVNFIFK